MGELGALFNPGMRHELEERRSKAARREEEGNARDGDLHIDLASGIAVINVPSDGEDDDAEGETPPAAAESDDVAPAAQESAGAATEGLSAVADKAALRPRGKRGMSSPARR